MAQKKVKIFMNSEKTAEYFNVFSETFKIGRDGIPGSWEVERNSDLPHPGIALEESCLNIFAPGNKFLPMVPELSDCRIETVFDFDNELSKKCELQLLFRYDRFRRTGQGGRLKLNANQMLFEYGNIVDNMFKPIQSTPIKFDASVFDTKNTLLLDVQGDKMNLELLNVGKAEFSGLNIGSGAVTLCRGAFGGYVSISKFEISAPNKFIPQCEREFEIILPKAVDGNYHPIKCAVKIREFDDIIDMELELSGSVQDEPLGNGNYHAMRIDKVTKPFLKVITAKGADKYTLEDGTLMLTNHELAPAYYYHVIYDDPEWPMRRRIQFRRPQGEFTFALGYEYFWHNPNADQAGGPSETLFDISGKTFYSGHSFIDIAQLVEFKSPPNKAIIDDLPKTDPRYEKAVEFAQNNHYFNEHEDVYFDVVISSIKELPTAITITLENAFFESIKTLEAQNISSNNHSVGAVPRKQNIYHYTLGKLEPGVYHIRCRSVACVDDLNEYCAFEVMPENLKSKPAPLHSGMPFLFSSLTETRGLETDAFDPWNGSSVNAGHYTSCTVYHPGFAKRNKIWDIVHLYGREWFAWLTNRTTDNHEIDDNIDIIKNCDYINYDLPVKSTFLWSSLYEGELLKCLIRFIKTLKNNPCKYLTVEKLTETVGCLARKAYYELTKNYWDEWLDFANEWYNDEYLLAENRRFEVINPNIKFSGYGPAPIYASHYKGINFTRYLGINSNTEKYHKGFFLYEDYPMLSHYGLARGVFFLAACKKVLPATKIYPEIYTICDQGCHDGALAYAFPPFGLCLSNPPARIKRRIFEYSFATGWHDEKGFHFWRDYGFQIGGFDTERYKILLGNWTVIRDHSPFKPLKASAFISSSECCRKSKAIAGPMDCDGHMGNAYKTSEECIAFAYETARESGLQAGFQTSLESIAKLSSNDIDLLVLPPLADATGKDLNNIRKLHQEGVNLLGFEDITGLEDLFGVEEIEKVRIHNLRAVKDNQAFCDCLTNLEEYTDHFACEGKYKAKTASVLIDAEIPVLLTQTTATGKTALFNVPPTVVRRDQLDQRVGYGRQSVSKLINSAMAAVLADLSDAAVTTTAGQLIAFEAEGGESVVIVENISTDKTIAPIVHIHKRNSDEHIQSCDVPYQVLAENDYEISLCLKLEAELTAVIVIANGVF